MDLDAYTAAHHDGWSRLGALGRRRNFSGQEADELIERYQAGATELSAIKTSAGSTLVGDRLSVSLSMARLRFTGASTNVLRQIPTFFALHLPAALYRLRWLTLATGFATVLIAFLYYLWAIDNPQVLANFGTDAELRRFAEQDFVNYYSENPAASFTGQVWTNNAFLAARCIAFGIIGLYVPVVVMQNAQNLGVSAAVLFHYDYGDVFFISILPHGLLELTCVFVAAAAGMRIFWSWISPGGRTRSEALAEDARALFTVAIGLVFALLVAGIIEGFVTPQPWPWPIKIGIGVLALAAFLGYMLILGSRVSRAGETGDLDEFESGAKRIIAA